LEVQITELNSKVKDIQLQGERKQVARSSMNQNINSVVNPTVNNSASYKECNITEVQEPILKTNHFVFSDISLPKFGNKQSENPLIYIKKLENFFQLRMVTETSKLIMIKNSLMGRCIAWFDMFVEGTSMTYSEFRAVFRAVLGRKKTGRNP
jgi:hypothetical protein